MSRKRHTLFTSKSSSPPTRWPNEITVLASLQNQNWRPIFWRQVALASSQSGASPTNASEAGLKAWTERFSISGSWSRRSPSTGSWARSKPSGWRRLTSNTSRRNSLQVGQTFCHKICNKIGSFSGVFSISDWLWKRKTIYVGNDIQEDRYVTGINGSFLIFLHC